MTLDHELRSKRRSSIDVSNVQSFPNYFQSTEAQCTCSTSGRHLSILAEMQHKMIALTWMKTRLLHTRLIVAPAQDPPRSEPSESVENHGTRSSGRMHDKREASSLQMRSYWPTMERCAGTEAPSQMVLDACSGKSQTAAFEVSYVMMHDDSKRPDSSGMTTQYIRLHCW